jgi:hypothetical protein
MLQRRKNALVVHVANSTVSRQPYADSLDRPLAARGQAAREAKPTLLDAVGGFLGPRHSICRIDKRT